jgi:hypothetical protein
MTSFPRVLVSGIDTLHLFTRRALDGAVVERLEQLKARAAGQAPNAAAVPFEAGGHRFAVRPHGARTAPLLLDSAHLAVLVNPAATSTFPTACVEFRALYLWQHGAMGAVDRAVPALRDIVPALDLNSLSVTRVDLTVDFQGWLPEPTHLDRLVTRARRDRSHFELYRDQRRFTGFSIGRGDVHARLYDKTAEIERSGKSWFRAIWARHPAYDHTAPVWRLELQLRRRALANFADGERKRLDTWAQVARCTRALWAHYCTRWVSLREPRTARTRQMLTPQWQALVDQGFATEPWAGIDVNLYRLLRESADGALVPQLAGYLARGYAQHLRRFGEDLAFEDSAQMLVLHAKNHAARVGRPIPARARERARQWLAAEREAETNGASGPSKGQP